ncbi:MAG: hypothetical protein FWE16_00185 [Firmicutes bacterium]|nr:hypothetical protein [Bacillota bacterium]
MANISMDEAKNALMIGVRSTLRAIENRTGKKFAKDDLLAVSKVIKKNLFNEAGSILASEKFTMQQAIAIVDKAVDDVIAEFS